MKQHPLRQCGRLADAQHYSSAADLALLAAAIVRDYPKLLRAVCTARLHLQQCYPGQS